MFFATRSVSAVLVASLIRQIQAAVQESNKLEFARVSVLGLQRSTTRVKTKLPKADLREDLHDSELYDRLPQTAQLRALNGESGDDSVKQPARSDRPGFHASIKATLRKQGGQRSARQPQTSLMETEKPITLSHGSALGLQRRMRLQKTVVSEDEPEDRVYSVSFVGRQRVYPMINQNAFTQDHGDLPLGNKEPQIQVAQQKWGLSIAGGIRGCEDFLPPSSPRGVPRASRTGASVLGLQRATTITKAIVMYEED
eukprot:TRINITY_DN64862_c0_g1_i1.p1 TRINITY_DN64862_c0_g1~~TRINITY_DN64862_c0_g1_i1.p1  ORF type:complete len:255 (-),score=27.64 TRINITY_DN64862_c0_g1_i1:40-804(-)